MISVSKVVAVQLDQRVEVDNHRGDSRQQDDLVRNLVNPASRRRIQPEDHRDATHHELNPDAGDDGAQPLDLGGGDPALRDIHKEARDEVQKHQPHAVHLLRRSACR